MKKHNRSDSARNRFFDLVSLMFESLNSYSRWNAQGRSRELEAWAVKKVQETYEEDSDWKDLSR